MHALTLHIAPLRFRFRALRPVALGTVPLATVRSALGASLRVIACETGMPTCAGCPLLEACAYAILFEAPPRPDTLHAGFENGPRPYILHADPALKPEYAQGETFAVEVRLLEQARLTLPSLVRAADRMARKGVGDHRGAGQGQLSLTLVEDARTSEILWMRGEAHLRAWPKMRPLEVPPIPHDPNVGLHLALETPMHLRRDNAEVTELTSEDLVRAAYRRVVSLSLLSGRLEHAQRAQFSEMVAHSKTVPVAESRVSYREESRYSRRQGKRFPLTGFVGELTLGPGWQPLWPLLYAGQYLHLGKHTTHGQGQYRLTPVPLPEPISL